MTIADDQHLDQADAPPGEGGASPRWRPSWLQLVALGLAVAFLAGAVGFLVGDRRGSADPLSTVDVGYLRDMGYHHDQATEMSLILTGKDDIDPNLKAFANEIVVGQRFEQGIFNATLDRYGHTTDVGDEVMGWMGEPAAPDEMVGLATPEQMDQLRQATGDEAAALWIALMSEHHLAGLHMADYEARHGQDETTVNLAEATVKSQRGEVIDLARYRKAHDLPIPEGFTDPLEDQRLNPISFADPGD